MQPSSLGYGSESDLARVLISCGQVANYSFGLWWPARGPTLSAAAGLFARAGLRAGAVAGTADGRFRRHYWLAARC